MIDSEQPAVAASAPPRETVGQMLRTARLAQEVTVEQVATELRIEAKQLTALEENRFELIGVPVFVKGYLKQYGQRLGLDVRNLLALYHQQSTLTDVQIQPNRTIKLRDERQITTWILAAIVLLTVVIGLAVWWANGGSFEARFGLGTPTPDTTSVPPAAPDPGLAASPVVVTPASLARAGTPPAATTAPEPGAEPTASAALAAVPVVGAPVPAEADVDAEDARAAAAVTIPLEFAFEQESWAEVTDARGEQLLFGLSPAGRRATVRGEPPFAIVIGNAAAVRLLVDGEPYAIPTAGREGALARFSVDIAEE